MSDRDEPAEWTQHSKLGQLRYSITTLLRQFGHTDSLTTGAAVNTGFVLGGTAFYWYFDGILSYIGAVIALIHLAAIAKGVLEA